MRKLLVSIICIGTIVFAGIANAQVSGSLFKLSSGVILPINSGWQFEVPQLGGSGIRCVQVDNNGLFSVFSGGCSSGGGGSSYPFPVAGNATTTLTQFNGGLTAYASSTIGNGTQTGGLIISGGATTTGQLNAKIVNVDKYSAYYQDGLQLLYASSTNFATLVGQSAGGTGPITSNTPTYMTAIGYQALFSDNTSGLNNVAMGYQTMHDNTSGSQNTAIGVQALPVNINGNYNTAFGYKAATNVLSGSNNTCIGVLCLQATNGSGNVALGYNAGYNSTASNSFFVNNVNESSETNDKAFSLLYGVFSGSAASLTGQQLTVNGLLGIGTTTPWAQLSINPNGIAGPAFAIGSSTQTSFVVTNGGNVGIGTTSPYALLSIGNTGGIGFGLGTSTFNTTGGINLNGGCFAIGGTCLALGGTNYWTLNGNNIYNNNNSGNGFVGIGTTTPDTLLTIATSTISYKDFFKVNIATSSVLVTPVSTIAFDTSAQFAQDSSPGGTATFSYTVGAGTNRILFVGTTIATGNTVSGVTYNGVAMTQLNTQAISGATFSNTYLFYLVNPASGAHNIVVTGTGTTFMYSAAESFSGVDQNTPIDANTTTTTTGTSITASVTTTKDNDWLVGWQMVGTSAGSALSAGANTTIRQTNGSNWYTIEDTNAAQTPPGSKSLTVNVAASRLMGMNIAAIMPSQAATTTAVSSIMTTAFIVSSTTATIGINSTTTPAVGIGTTTPAATFAEEGFWGAIIRMVGSVINGVHYVVEEIDSKGHLITGGPVPSVSGGTSTVSGNDRNGTITVTGTLLTSVTLTFAQAYAAAPDCTMADSSTGVTGAISSISTTQLVIGFSAGINSGTVWYICQQHQ
jgi:hypothetical protein